MQTINYELINDTGEDLLIEAAIPPSAAPVIKKFNAGDTVLFYDQRALTVARIYKAPIKKVKKNGK